MRSPRRLSPALLLAFLVQAVTAPAGAQGTARLELLVRETGTGRPIGAATVRIVETGQFAVTDATGYALLMQVPAGRQTVEVRHPGHAPLSATVEFVGAMASQLQVAMQVQPIELQGIAVTVEAQEAGLRRAGFYHRQKAYWGSFLGPEELTDARRRGTQLSDLMRGRTGVAVERSPRGGYILASSRSRGAGGCRMAIFVDGIRQHGVEDIDRLIAMMDVAAIEAYASRFSTPMEFQAGGYCGAVVIWTPRNR